MREHEFVSLIENAISKSKKGLVEIKPEGKAIVVGDLHGDMNSLRFILEDSNLEERMEKERLIIIFLGDYGDRGEYAPEVYWTILNLKNNFKDRVILLKGNHEGPFPVFPHDLPIRFRRRFGSDRVYEHLRVLWECLPHAAIVHGRYLFVHGGIPARLKSIDDLSGEKYIEEILWSDPREIEGVQYSMRGAGMYFGRDVTERVLGILGVKTLIRSHEPCDGVFPAHEGRVLTLFSCKAPYGNLYAAYLDLNLTKAEDAYKIAKKARIF
ncbi:MAG: metallophosphoesterase family protein [Candidatus Syntropharchaeia archaeon]